MWWPFRPKHTLESVLEELVEGIGNGTIVPQLPDDAESPEVSAPEPQPHNFILDFVSSRRTAVASLSPLRRPDPPHAIWSPYREAVRGQRELVATGHA